MSRRDPDTLRLAGFAAGAATTLGLLALLVWVVASTLVHAVGDPARTGALARRAVLHPAVQRALVHTVVRAALTDAGLDGDPVRDAELEAAAAEVLSSEQVGTLAADTGAALWAVHVGEARVVPVDVTPVLTTLYQRFHAAVPAVSATPPRAVAVTMRGDGELGPVVHRLTTVARTAGWVALGLLGLGVLAGRGTLAARFRRLGVRLGLVAGLLGLAAWGVPQVAADGWLELPVAVLGALSHELWRPAAACGAVALGLVALGAMLGTARRLAAPDGSDRPPGAGGR